MGITILGIVRYLFLDLRFESNVESYSYKTSSCCNVDKGIYYYITYENNQITGVDMYRENLSGNQLIIYPMILEQQVRMQN